MSQLWKDTVPFPKYAEMETVPGIRYEMVHVAEEGQYQFALGAGLVKHNGLLYASWANSWRAENDNNTIYAEKCSYDGGKTWENYRRISKKEEGF